MLELSAVDSATGQPVNAKYDVLDERKERPVVLLRDKYLARSVLKNMLRVLRYGRGRKVILYAKLPLRDMIH
ncbi:MAG: hypothetical protein WDO15_06365 [Bacteroidota bacterium]